VNHINVWQMQYVHWLMYLDAAKAIRDEPAKFPW
jgi:hypothetical protein